MGEEKDGLVERPKSRTAAPTPSKDRPTRHSFILHLIPDFPCGPDKPPRWRGELNHTSGGNPSPPEEFDNIHIIPDVLRQKIRKVLGINMKSGFKQKRNETMPDKQIIRGVMHQTLKDIHGEFDPVTTKHGEIRRNTKKRSYAGFISGRYQFPL